MSEQDEQRPLTRRERRLREMAETGALDLSDVSAESAPETVTAESAAPPENAQADSGEVEISPYHEDGTPRSRREMRELRERALAEREAARQAQAAPAAAEESDAAEVLDAVEVPAAPVEESFGAAVSDESTSDEDEVDSVEQPTAGSDEEPAPLQQLFADESSAEPGAVSGAPAETSAPAIREETGSLDFDSLIAPPTQPFTVEDLREAEQAAVDPADGAADIDDSADTIVEKVAEEAAEEAAESEASAVDPTDRQKRRFWKRGKSVEADEAAADTGTDSDGTSAVEAAAVDAAVEPEESAAQEWAAPAVPAESDELPVPEPVIVDPQPVAGPKSDYSFPDIVPPEEWRSVFDDPASRSVPNQGETKSGNEPKIQGDFDDLISRAVAQEGSSGSDTSALILPSMPEDTGGLTGPLGGTGDLYVTGSLKLPKSIGETGGHASLHDSIEIDPLVEPAPDEAQMTGGMGPAPVSARQAVSARMSSSIPVVAKPAKEKSKLPLVLSLSGGGLLVVVVGIGVWGGVNGWFG